MAKSTIPEKLFCWNFQTEKGGWEKGWGGYCRATNLHPMDERERNTGAVYARLDLVKEKDTTDEFPSPDARLDRIEELEAERDEALNQLDSARHSIGVLEKRVAMLLKGEKDE